MQNVKRKAGRPPLPDPRNFRVEVCLSLSEHEALNLTARARGLAVGPFVREIALERLSPSPAADSIRRGE
jgi:hypothetical protein